MRWGEKTTLVIPTRNRYPLLSRLLRFYSLFDLGLRILVLDSSDETEEPSRLSPWLGSPKVEVRRFPPDRLPIPKLAQGLRSVRTPYVFLCADDDFILPAAVDRCVAFLEENRDYTIAHGYYMLLPDAFEPGRRLECAPCYPYQKSQEASSPSRRLREHFGDYSGTTFYAVHRTPSLAAALEETQAKASDWGLTELLPSGLTIIDGKMKVLPIPYAARSSPAASGGGAVGSTPDQWYLPEKVAKVADSLARRLAAAEGISREEALRVSETSLRALIERELAATRSQRSSGRPARRVQGLVREVLKRAGMLQPARRLLGLVRGYDPGRPIEAIAAEYRTLLSAPSPFGGDVANMLRCLEHPSSRGTPD
ncbi:MAG: TIGR00180 family glycosyltransferase [Elusimicrobia bacterium]|nr:TIGR00180 family glycosyltransferase [Elusimicrobiota bacterium]